MRKRGLLLITGVCLAALSLGVGSAFADPNPPIITDRPLAGVSSEIAQDVLNGFANGTTASVPPFAGIKDGSGKLVMSSFDASGSTTITTHLTTECTNILRWGGWDTISALDEDTNGCIQWARSSSDLSAAHPNDTFIPFATDALTFASASITNVPKTFTKTQLTTIYSRNAAQGCIRQPLLPHLTSATRIVWLEVLGIGGGGQPALGDCVKDTLNGIPIEGNDGRVLTNEEQLVPFSAAQWTAQTNQGSVTGRHGPSVLRAINGIAWSDDAFPGIRTVYNVVRTRQISDDPTIRSTFVGSGSAVCSHPEVTRVFGFTPLTGSACGATTLAN